MLVGQEEGTERWCITVSNELDQILTSVFTREDSLEMVELMACHLGDRYERADEYPPKLMYVNYGCCNSEFENLHKELFDEWIEEGMMVRLDIFHWIKEFETAICFDHHSQHVPFKSALYEAVFSYNKDDLALLVKSIRAGLPIYLKLISDTEILKNHTKKAQLDAHVRHTTRGVNETYARVQEVIDKFKGSAGMEFNTHLFKDDNIIDEVWAKQCKHLECIQDPPGMNMYSVVKYVNCNGISLPKYKSIRGNCISDKFNLFLQKDIPGTVCTVDEFQVYLITGIAKWNIARKSESVLGQNEHIYPYYKIPLIDRMNRKHLRSYGEALYPTFRPPLPLGIELIGFEYLFDQIKNGLNIERYYHQIKERILTVDECVPNNEMTDHVEYLDNDTDDFCALFDDL